MLDHVVQLPPDPAKPDDVFPFCSVEDIILNKLMWYDHGDRVSERQWLDLLTVIRVQHDVLDRAYLDEWAGYLDVAGLLGDLLDQARGLDGR